MKRRILRSSFGRRDVCRSKRQRAVLHERQNLAHLRRQIPISRRRTDSLWCSGSEGGWIEQGGSRRMKANANLHGTPAVVGDNDFVSLLPQQLFDRDCFVG